LAIATPLAVTIVVNYNFFLSLGVCKLLVGVYSSPGLSPQEAGLMGKKTRSPPALCCMKKARRDKKSDYSSSRWEKGTSSRCLGGGGNTDGETFGSFKEELDRG
jgi:hypothetical protein